MQKTILFLTTNSLATNPRLVKEIDLAVKNNFIVKVICFEFNNWSKEFNYELLKSNKYVEFSVLRAERNFSYSWIKSFCKEKYYRLISKKFELNISSLSNAISRRSDLLISALNKINKADLVIGHNPGALYPTLYAASKLKCSSGFDVEDYHPGEGHDKHLQNITILLIKKSLEKFDYVSFASNLILQEVSKIFAKSYDKWFAILNFFPSNEFSLNLSSNNQLIKYVWFSQNIDYGRGLENIIPFFKNDSLNIELHLIGNTNNEFYREFLSNSKNIVIHQPISQKDLHNKLSNYDIGLALDLPVDENRDIAITNKILAYLQSGLYIIASDTLAHKYIIDKYIGVGKCYSQTLNDFGNILFNSINEIDQIRLTKKIRFYKFKNSSWEEVSKELFNTWKLILK